MALLDGSVWGGGHLARLAGEVSDVAHVYGVLDAVTAAVGDRWVTANGPAPAGQGAADVVDGALGKGHIVGSI